MTIAREPFLSIPIVPVDGENAFDLGDLGFETGEQKELKEVSDVFSSFPILGLLT